MASIILTPRTNLGILPLAGMMAIAIAAAASFASSVSQPANLVVMCMGGDWLVDYLRLGIPMTFVVFLVTVLFLRFV
jgi:di/tricarboxylate transporter